MAAEFFGWSAPLRELRLGAGLTQEQLADRCGLSVRTVRNLELGLTRPRPATARIIEGILGVDPGGPAQLPSGVRRFAARTAAVAELDATLESGGRLAVVSGTAGVGKTALAVHWARRVAARFPAGCLHLDLRGHHPGPPLRPRDAAGLMLGGLGVPAGRLPQSLHERTALLRTVTATRRLLVLLDNAYDAAQVRPLLPAGPGCFTLVTGRNRMRGLVAVDDGRPLVLGLPSGAEAREILTARLGKPADGAVTGEIVERCARLPLALAVVAARVATRPAVPLTAVAGELAADPLEALTTGDPLTDLRTVLSWSYLRLTPPAARLFRLLARAVPATFTRAGTPGHPRETRPLLDELADAHLIEEIALDRYFLHELLRSYGKEL